MTDASPTPSPDLADAPPVRRDEPSDAFMVFRLRQDGMCPDETVRCLLALGLTDVYFSRRHPEEMEDCLRRAKEMGDGAYVKVGAIRPDRRERKARGSARRASTQREELDGDAQDEPQAVAPTRRRRTAAHPRRRYVARHRRCPRCSSARAGTGGWMGRVKSRLCKVVFCFNALVATVHAFHSAAIYLECIRSQISILFEAFMQVIGAA